MASVEQRVLDALDVEGMVRFACDLIAIPSLVGEDLAGTTYGSDMRLLVNQGGTPALLFGPGDVRLAHRPDEYVPLEDLVTAAQTLALRFCGHESGSRGTGLP